ncbi:SDR family oxidoreductase [Leifsonia sp. RAF41]|uniref:SDR family oxidoreductase n=1 Tax=Leifsonia sp. RAF41 TaxID=3233056 RepID=UPI003F96B4B1
MRIVIAGGNGQIARIAERKLTEGGHVPIALIRNPVQRAGLEAAGTEVVVMDLEDSSVSEVAEVLTGADAVIFAAGSGPASPVERSLSMDRDGAILLALASVQAAIKRFILLSGAGADDYERDSQDGFQIYLHAKADADELVRDLELDWVIVRPDGLSDEAEAGLFEVGDRVPRRGITRSDVAAVLVRLATSGDVSRKQFEVTTGDSDLEHALATLRE